MRRNSNHFLGSHYDAPHSTGALRFLNPTARYHPLSPSPRPSSTESAAADGGPSHRQGQQQGQKHDGQGHYYTVWRSRDNRKGRHAVVVTDKSLLKRPVAGKNEEAEHVALRATNTLAETWRGVVKMATRFPVWDVSYDVAVVFTLGKLGSGDL